MVGDAADRNRLYDELAVHAPNAVELGGALITLVEPDVGFERSYNRWYEDDHFYAGAMVGPWAFAGGRWVATRELQLLRFPEHSPICRPLSTGCYLSAFWVTAGHLEDYEQWAATTMREALYPHGRGFDRRTHVYSGFHALAFATSGTSRLGAVHALDRRFPGLVLEVVERTDDWTHTELVRWLRDEHAPAWLQRGGAALCAGFSPRPLPPGSMPYARAIGGGDRRLTLLWFLEHDPQPTWDRRWAEHGAVMEEAGGCVISLCAPFVPTVPGTDTYVDELRAHLGPAART